MISQERLKELFSYCETTGEFTRLVCKGKQKAGAVAGTIHNCGYIAIGIDGKNYLAHRLAWLYVHGVLPSCEVDHVNRFRADNRIENLRLATRSMNAQNTTARSNGKSGIKGVTYRESTKRWIAQITVDNKGTYLGSFSTPEKAQQAYIEAAASMHIYNPVIQQRAA